MSMDTIAVLPPVAHLEGTTIERGGDWKEGAGPGGVRAAWRALRDGTLVNLGFPYQTADADLHDMARRWMGAGVPARIWVFPDTELADGDTAAAVRAATAASGRWIEGRGAEPGDAARGPLEELGFTAAEVDEWQRVVQSGDARRITAALAVMQKRLEGRDSDELQAILAKLVKPR